jgi:hypothetical protein
MVLKVIFTGILGLKVIISAMIAGACYIGRRRSEEHRRQFHVREIEKDCKGTWPGLRFGSTQFVARRVVQTS